MTIAALALSLPFIAPQAPAAAPPPPRLLVLETAAEQAYLQYVKAFGDLLATLLEQRTAAEVVAASSVKDRLAVAADKMATGCDDTSCMTEIAGAMDARYVVSSRASQVGGRWMLRVELFDSESLKVIAQSTGMADSVQALASQAEWLCDDLLQKAPVLPRRGADGAPTMMVVTDPNVTADPAKQSPGDDGMLLWGGLGAVGVAGLATVAWIYGYGSFLNRDSEFSSALDNYQENPLDEDARLGLQRASSARTDAAMTYGCLYWPLGVAGVGLCVGGAGAAGYALLADD